LKKWIGIKMNNKELINDIEYFLKKGTLQSFQQAQMLLDAAVQKKYFEENNFSFSKDKL
jgi:hypothetical protein